MTTWTATGRLERFRTGIRAGDTRLVVRVLTPLIIAGLALGMAFEYRRANAEAERRFSERQTYLAQKAADRLEQVFREVGKLLALLARLDTTADRLPAALTLSVEHLEEHGALAACTVDRAGKVIAASGPEAGPELRRLASTSSGCTGHGDVCVQGPLRSTLSPSNWVLVASVPAPDRGGSVMVVVDWGRLQALIVRITKLSKDTYSWVLDHEGRLVLHPEHQQQLGRSALEVGESCAECHTSFQLHRQMARGHVGSGRVQVANAEPKLVAYTPFAVGHHTWSLALATPASLVVGEGLRSQLSLFVFAGAIMLVMVAGALLLDRESSRRIRIAEAFNRDLERRVAERTDELRALYERLSTLQSHHTRLERVAVAGEMASIVAHEIRTPLNALSINAQMISRSLRRDTAESRQRALEVLGTLQHEIERINNLLEDHVLALVRHRRGEPEALCLKDLVLDSMRFVEAEAGRQQVTLISELGDQLSQVRADPAKLRQILLNIILNAIQAMPQGGEVRLSTRQEGEWAIVGIQDTGPGLPMPVPAEGEDLERVFRPFVTTKQDGTGLGLAVCVRLIRGMKGRIHVRSRPGEGACFEVMLPTDSEERKRCP